MNIQYHDRLCEIENKHHFHIPTIVKCDIYNLILDIQLKTVAECHVEAQAVINKVFAERSKPKEEPCTPSTTNP